MAAIDKLDDKQKPLLAPLDAHKEWAGLMNKELAALVLDGKADAREAADFILARFIRKAAA